MRSFQQVLFLLVALVAFAFAAESQYDATVYVTSTIYRVNTVTLSSSPAYPVANSTTTIAPSATGYNSTVPYPTGTGAVSTGMPAQPSSSNFPGAASGLSVNGAFLAIFAAGLGFLAL